MKNLQKGSIKVIIVIIFALVVVGAGGYYFKTKKIEAPIAEEAADWKTFNDSRYDFQFQYPAFQDLTFSDSGQEFNPTYTHLLVGSSTAISITKEEVDSNSCHLGLCSNTAISSVINDPLVWDNLGPQRYCDGGGGCTHNGPIYRLIFKGSRYYMHFNQDFFGSGDKIERVIKSWQSL